MAKPPKHLIPTVWWASVGNGNGDPPPIAAGDWLPAAVGRTGSDAAGWAGPPAVGRPEAGPDGVGPARVAVAGSDGVLRPGDGRPVADRVINAISPAAASRSPPAPDNPPVVRSAPATAPAPAAAVHASSAAAVTPSARADADTRAANSRAPALARRAWKHACRHSDQSASTGASSRRKRLAASTKSPGSASSPAIWAATAATSCSRAAPQSSPPRSHSRSRSAQAVIRQAGDPVATRTAS